ncbi:uncharacterized protein LOC131168021 isoform X2 [Malania oleifera]|uniref:uncharacterized protein LOC131168021 isoform X2 n=1 Tax=Malania oleifera TaxID=397392 RepID=UPI0025AE05C8|nr:uncharacterized protein LOC131168021 isoform X2 [Malania oleifera]
MEFFNKAKAVRLKSHLGKYLVAGDDEEAVRQSRDGSSSRARWAVEFVEGRSHVVRLKSCHGQYLTAADEPFLLGMTGKKVVQTQVTVATARAMEWEPIKEGFQVKMRARRGKFLRANGGTPPWRNSVTHDVPHRSATQDWVLWEVEVVDIKEFDLELSASNHMSPAWSFSSVFSEDLEALDTASSPTLSSISSSRHASGRQSETMELFNNARCIRLRGRHDKYLLADEDQEGLCHDRNASSRRSKWTVEFVEGGSFIRLRSCYGKYLTATDIPFLLGVTGKKVLQTTPRRLDSSVEWEPIREGFQVRLKTRYGNFLRANGGVPPWRNSITHDIPHRTVTQDWILWDVEVVDLVQLRSKEPVPVSQPTSRTNSSLTESSSPAVISLKSPRLSFKSPKLTKQESSDSFVGSPVKDRGRDIYYSVADDYGDVDEGIEEANLSYKGNEVEELKQKLEEETGLDDVIVCSRNPLNGKLFPLRLALPPNNTTMHVVVVPSSSQAARYLETPESPTPT